MVFVKYDCSFLGTNRNVEFVLDSTMPLFFWLFMRATPFAKQRTKKSRSFLSAFLGDLSDFLQKCVPPYCVCRFFFVPLHKICDNTQKNKRQ